MRWVRTWLPLAIIAAGVAIMVASGGSQDGLEGGGLVISAGLSVWLLNFFFRVGVKGDLERDEEDRAREYYDRHGYWPDEAPEHEAHERDRDAPPAHPPQADSHRERPRPHRERPVRRPNRRGP
jgi:hypothetical protein